ncbi:Cytochrome P450 [Mycena kentingensis (nom. inval.)]|nr:Cytochrome P450 [Mycena kentingensis (nom. inval.)]
MDALSAVLQQLRMIDTSNMRIISKVLLPILGLSACYALAPAFRLLYAEMISPFRDMDGPRNPSLLMGNFKDVADDIQVIGRWRRQFGRVFKYKGLFSVTNIYVEDAKAVAHIAHNVNLYQKAEYILEDAKRLVGPGVLSLDGEEHRRQRKIINHAFGPAQIRLLTEGIVARANQLRDVWSRQVKNPDGQVIDAYLGLRQMTLDVIGEAGFNYEFDALEQRSGKPNELDDLFTHAFHSPESQTAAGFHMVQTMFPALRPFPLPGVRGLHKVTRRMMEIAGEIVQKSKAALTNSDDLSGKRDLLSVLLSANIDPMIPERQRLSDAEVIAQIPGFLVAGHETTATASAWAVHALSTTPRVQTKLREQLFTLETDTPTMEELNGLGYLDWVVRETLRLYAPVIFIQRIAAQDDVLPLSHPYTDKQGNTHSALALVVPKGQVITIPFLGLNTAEDIWATMRAQIAFRPERWAKLSDTVNEIPSVYSSMMTFWAGGHSCMGWQFAVTEYATLLHRFL